MSAWRLAARVAGHALALVAVLLCVVLPRSRYDWVSGVDPTVRTSDLVSGDNAAVAIGTCAALAIAVELIALATGSGRRGKLVPAVLIVAVGAAWLDRSLG